MLLREPTAATNPFYNSVPEPVFWPMLILATLATTIASQSLITGCFSLMHQAVSLGYCPPLDIYHTSNRVYGQIYIPIVNWVLLVLTVILTVSFQKYAKKMLFWLMYLFRSAIIGDAFGVTVSTVMMLTSIVYAAVMVLRYKSWWPKVVLFCVLFFPLDFVYWIANLTKIPHAGWISLLFATLFGTPMICWYYGEWKLKIAIKVNGLSFTELTESYLTDSMRNDSIYSSAFKSIAQVNSRYPGVSVFYCPTKSKIPESFRKLTNRLQSVAETLVFCHTSVEHIPFVDEADRLNVIRHGDIYIITLRYGYADVQEDIIDTLSKIGTLPNLLETNVTVFVDSFRITIAPTRNFVRKGMLKLYSLEKLIFREKLAIIRDNSLLVDAGINVTL